MHLVLLNQFYPPDVAPTGQYLHDLACALVERGHRVTVLSSRHAYGGGGDYAPEEWLQGVRVLRLQSTAFGRASYAGKLLDYGGYYGGVLAQLARLPQPDLILALTTPPFLGLAAQLAARLRGCRHAHWVMDLYPDVMHAHGMVRGAPLRALELAARQSLAGAACVITLGPAMAEHVRRYTRDERVEWVPLWTPQSLTAAPHAAAEPSASATPPGRLTLLYSGNFGLGHRFQEFLEAARRLGPDGPRWVLAGKGRARASVEAFVAANPEVPIELRDYVPPGELRRHLLAADAHLISLDPRWEGSLLPSKLQASFALGRPVIYVGDPCGDLGRWIAEAGAGWVVAPGDVEGLCAAVAQASDPVTRRERGEQGRRYAADRFDRDRNVARMIALLEAQH